jgi:phosphoglycerol transferase MdoB-like AlkP superfamily enzyme
MIIEPGLLVGTFWVYLIISIGVALMVGNPSRDSPPSAKAFADAIILTVAGAGIFLFPFGYLAHVAGHFYITFVLAGIFFVGAFLYRKSVM